MDTHNPIHVQVDKLSGTVQTLLDNYLRVCEENRSLMASQEQLASERAALMARNERAHSRIEAMIQRLKSLETAG